jgi:hypothetical protein
MGLWYNLLLIIHIFVLVNFRQEKISTRRVKMVNYKLNPILNTPYVGDL